MSWLVFLCALPAQSRADASKQCVPDDPLSCAQPLKLHEPAPFEGQLLTPKMALLLGQKAELCAERAKLVIEYNDKINEIDLTLEKQLRTIDKDMSGKMISVLETELAEARKPPPVIERPWFVATITAAITLGLTAAGLAVAVKVIEVRKTPATNP